SVTLNNAHLFHDVPSVVIAEPFKGISKTAVSNVSFSKKRDLGFLEPGYGAGPFASAGVNVGVPILDYRLPSAGVGAHGLVSRGAHGSVRERDLGLSRASGSKLVQEQVASFGDVSSPYVSFKVIDSNLVCSQGFAVLAPKHKGFVSDSNPIPQRNGGVPSFA
ncbi:hypothetical protein PanWU01x14_224180, partial [Parasponia andersonii]